jgi:hypothetical protein
MTVTLHLGVIDISYLTVNSSAELRQHRWLRKAKPWEHSKWNPSSGQTTGSVAELLEAKYHIMQTFAEQLHPDVISTAVEEAVRGKVENLMMGAPGGEYDSPFERLDLSRIEEAFRDSIDNREYDGVLSGVPTQAAQRGINHRLKRPYSKQNLERPSFFDTGTYHASMRAWLSDE